MPEALAAVAVVAAAGTEAAAGAATIDTLMVAWSVSGSAGLTAAASATAASAISFSTIASIALSVGASVGLNMLNQSGESPMTQNAAGQLTVRQALPARWVYFGRGRSSGVLFFYDAQDNGQLYIGKILACHPIGLIEQDWFLDFPISVDGSGHPTLLPSGREAWATLTSIERSTGSYDQASPSILLENWASGGIWTAAHRLRGLAYAVVAYQDVPLKDMQANYPNGAPEYKATIRGARCFDPRDTSQFLVDETSWQYTDNAALAIGTFLVWQNGWGLPLSVINEASLAAAAVICDEQIPTDGGGDTEARYRTWGRYELNESRKTVLNDLLLNCNGRIALSSDGTIRLDVGKYAEPTVTLDDDSIIEVRSFMDGPDPVDRVGALAPRIVYEAYNWQETACPLVEVPLSPDPDGGGTTTRDVPLRFCPSPFQAQRIAKKLAGDLTGWRGTIVTTLAGLAAYDQRYIRITLSEYEIDAPFEVLGISIDLPTMTLQISVREVDPTIYDWTGGTALAAAATAAASTFPDTVAPDPPTFTASLSVSTVELDLTAPVSANVTKLRVTIALVATPTVTTIVVDQSISPSVSIVAFNAPGTGNWRFSATALNGSGLASTAVTQDVNVP